MDWGGIPGTFILLTRIPVVHAMYDELTYAINGCLFAMNNENWGTRSG